MVARINTGKSIEGALSYNEVKVAQGKAELILGSHFSCDVNDLGFAEKLNRFQRLTALNERRKTNTLHLSLNFSPEEYIDTEKMREIALSYMEQIGFAEQPFLVYRHNDAAHDHLHIVTTNIKSNGTAIPFFNIGKSKSEPARQNIEEEFGLIKAQGRSFEFELQSTMEHIDPAVYSKEQTKKKISNIVLNIMKCGRFTNMEEFNAILRQYNVVCTQTPGERKGKKGLVYSIVDKDGHKSGIPIRASAIYTSPTIANISKCFEKNQVKKTAYLGYARMNISKMLRHSSDEKHFMSKLKAAKWGCMLSYDRFGDIEKIVFVDLRLNLAYPCEELGFNRHKIIDFLSRNDGKSKEEGLTWNAANLQHLHHNQDDANRLFDILFHDENTGPDVSSEFLKKKRKKKNP